MIHLSDLSDGDELVSRTIRVTPREVYGNTLIYPACQVSELLAKLAGRKTFTRGDLKTIQALGYSIELKYPAAVRV